MTSTSLAEVSSWLKIYNLYWKFTYISITNIYTAVKMTNAFEKICRNAFEKISQSQCNYRNKTHTHEKIIKETQGKVGIVQTTALTNGNSLNKKCVFYECLFIYFLNIYFFIKIQNH